MPADRFIHPRLGHSAKISSLSDFEFRVWATYVLTADDFGVMRASPVTLQAANDALLMRPTRVVERALMQLIEVGLLVSFEDQARKYVCQWDWQDFQRVQYPRETLNPKPPASIIAGMSDRTQALFSVWNCGSKAPKARRRSEAIPENSRIDTEPDGKILDLARAHGREMANGIRLMANGKRLTANARAESFDRFWAVYPRKVGKGAARRQWERLKPSDELTAVIIAAVERQRESPQWTKDAGQFIPHPATWLHQERWQDEPDTPVDELAAARKAFLGT